MDWGHAAGLPRGPRAHDRTRRAIAAFIALVPSVIAGFLAYRIVKVDTAATRGASANSLM
jgi:hypothetical protein